MSVVTKTMFLAHIENSYVYIKRHKQLSSWAKFYNSSSTSTRYLIKKSAVIMQLIFVYIRSILLWRRLLTDKLIFVNIAGPFLPFSPTSAGFDSRRPIYVEGADLIGGSGSDQIRVASGGRLVHTVVAGGSGEQYPCNACLLYTSPSPRDS